MIEGSEDDSVIYGDSDDEYDEKEENDDDIKLKDLKILTKKGVKKTVLKECLKVRKLFRNLGRLIVPGSKWYLVSMSWLKKWEKFVFFNEICQMNEKSLKNVKNDREDPGPINCSDIIATIPE